MKALILHLNHYRVSIETPSERIDNIEPEVLRDNLEEMRECLLVLFQVEENDADKQINRLCKDVQKIANYVGTKRVMMGACAHLSHSRPSLEVAKDIALQVVDTCKSWIEYEVDSSHFGYNKTTLLDIKGHQHSVKYRSY